MIGNVRYYTQEYNLIKRIQFGVYQIDLCNESK